MTAESKSKAKVSNEHKLTPNVATLPEASSTVYSNGVKQTRYLVDETCSSSAPSSSTRIPSLDSEVGITKSERVELPRFMRTFELEFQEIELRVTGKSGVKPRFVASSFYGFDYLCLFHYPPDGVTDIFETNDSGQIFNHTFATFHEILGRKSKTGYIMNLFPYWAPSNDDGGMKYFRREFGELFVAEVLSCSCRLIRACLLHFDLFVSFGSPAKDAMEYAIGILNGDKLMKSSPHPSFFRMNGSAVTEDHCLAADEAFSALKGERIIRFTDSFKANSHIHAGSKKKKLKHVIFFG